MLLQSTCKYWHRYVHFVDSMSRNTNAGNTPVSLLLDQITLENVIAEVFGEAAVKTHGNQNKRERDDQSVLAKGSIYSDVSQHTPSNLNKNGNVVGQERNMMLNFCKNCRPLQGEKIKGVVSQGLGVKIHRLGCKTNVL